MAGLAVMLAGVDGFDRPGLLALAEVLHPGAGEPEVFSRWLQRSPLRPYRFLPIRVLLSAISISGVKITLYNRYG